MGLRDAEPRDVLRRRDLGRRDVGVIFWFVGAKGIMVAGDFGSSTAGLLESRLTVGWRGAARRGR